MSFWTVYLSGEIHTDWRERIIQGCAEKELDIEFSGPVTDHEASDKVGVNILGAEEKRFWEDRLGAGINGIRTRKLIDEAYERAKQVLNQRRKDLDDGARMLLEKETITPADFPPLVQQPLAQARVLS